MLPEQPNKSHLFLTYFEFDSNKAPHSRLICSHPFNYEIQILLAAEDGETVLNTIQNHEQHYYELEAPLSILLDPNFMDETLTKKTGDRQETSSLYMHTVDTFLDTEDVAILDGDGCLVLSLQKETYESFGLEGKAAKFAGKGQRYIISLDLSSPSFRPGNKTYDRAKWCLDNNLSRNFKMVITRVNKTTGESLDIPFSSMTHQKKTISWNSKNMEGIRLPTFKNLLLPNGTSPNNQWKDDAMEAHEWLGLASLGAQRLFANDKPDPFLSVYSCPEPYATGNITLLRSTGLASPQYIEHLLVVLRKEIKLKQCWGALTVWGYRDSPIAWRGQEHGFLTNGENDYTILLLNEEKNDNEQHAVCYQALGVYDVLQSILAQTESTFGMVMEPTMEKYRLNGIPEAAYYIPNFISPSEEEYLVSKVQTAPTPKWVTLKARRLQNWGGTPSALHGKMIQEPVPTWLSNPIYSRLRDVGVNFSENNNSLSEPNHILVNEYLPGQGIMPHQDGPLYNSIVATVTLNSHSILNFYPHASNVTSTIEKSSEPEFSVLLEPRSLFIQTGQLYKTYLHGIAELTEDDFVENPPINYDQSSTSSILHRGTRISLTYRRVKKVIKNPFSKSIFK